MARTVRISSLPTLVFVVWISMVLSVIHAGIDWWTCCQEPKAVVAFTGAAIMVGTSYGPVDQFLSARMWLNGLVFYHVVFGMSLDLYESSYLFDKALHALSIGGLVLVIADASAFLCAKRNLLFSNGLLRILAYSGALAAGSLWEITEFAIDQFTVFHTQRGLTDTMFDLIANTIGATAGFFIARHVDAATECAVPKRAKI